MFNFLLLKHQTVFWSCYKFFKKNSAIEFYYNLCFVAHSDWLIKLLLKILTLGIVDFPIIKLVSGKIRDERWRSTLKASLCSEKVQEHVIEKSHFLSLPLRFIFCFFIVKLFNKFCRSFFNNFLLKLYNTKVDYLYLRNFKRKPNSFVRISWF